MTTAPPTNKHWFRKLIHGQPHQIIGVWVFWCRDRFGETRSRQYEVERFVPYYDWHEGGCGEPIEPGRVRADD